MQPRRARANGQQGWSHQGRPGQGRVHAVKMWVLGKNTLRGCGGPDPGGVEPGGPEGLFPIEGLDSKPLIEGQNPSIELPFWVG